MLVRAVTLGTMIVMTIGCGDDAGGARVDAQQIDSPVTTDSAVPGACDPVAQTCSTIQRCTLNHNTPNTTFCESGTGTQAEFTSCTPNASSDDCMRGTVCLQVGMTTSLVCKRFCNTDSDCAGNVCSIAIGNTIGPLHACAQKCQVLNQSTCTVAGESCYLGLNVTGQLTQQCSPTGSKVAGDACAIANDCTPGLVCIKPTMTDGGATDFTCHKACNAGTNTTCMASGDCQGGSCCPFPNQGGLGYCL
jgi:hypothetical protein